MVELEIDGHVAHIKLNRPEKLNAMNWDFWEELPVVVQTINENLEVRVAVISGVGRAFSVGLDFFDMMPKLQVKGTGPDGASQQRLHTMIRHMQWSVTSLERCRVPVIAAIQGYCLGGGIDLITACDIRVCSAETQFGVRETKMAIVADIGTLQRLPRIVPPGIARELIYSGRDFGSTYAAQIGLVNEVCPDQNAAIERSLELAMDIAANAPLAVQGSKHVLNQAQMYDIDRGLEYVATYNAAHLMSRDLGHAIESMAMKQKPIFEGR